MSRKLKPWHELARELFIGSQGNISGLEIFRQIKSRLPKDTGPTHPTTVQIFIRKNREQWMKFIETGLERPWHLGTLTKNPLPLEGLPRILEIHKAANYPVTVRRAHWIAYLSPFIKDTTWLKTISFSYAILDRHADLSGMEFDSSPYDKLLEGKENYKKLSELLDNAVMRIESGES